MVRRHWRNIIAIPAFVSLSFFFWLFLKSNSSLRSDDNDYINDGDNVEGDSRRVMETK